MRGVFTEQEQRRVFVVVGVFLVVREHDFGIVSVDDFAEKFVEGFIRRDGVAVDLVGLLLVWMPESPMYLASKREDGRGGEDVAIHSQNE